MDTPQPSFEYYALRFLLQWEQRERELHTQLANDPTLQQLRAGLHYFQVARNFAGLRADDTAQAILEALMNIDFQEGPSPDEKVVALASRFRERLGKFNLSAASKLLWLRHKRPYIIYDSRAVHALRKLGSILENGNYAQYARCWREEYTQRENEIKKAASRLNEVRAFLTPWDGSAAELMAITAEPWFLERVFDTYLWEMGGQGRQWIPADRSA